MDSLDSGILSAATQPACNFISADRSVQSSDIGMPIRDDKQTKCGNNNYLVVFLLSYILFEL